MSALSNRIGKITPPLWARTLPKRPSAPGAGDRSLVIVVVGIGLLGLAMVYSASGVLAGKSYGDSAYFLKRQMAWMALGLCAFALVTAFDYQRLRGWVGPMLCLVLALLGSVLLFGAEINGSRRWLRLGPFTFQPSEPAKLITVIYLAHYIAKKGERLRDFFDGLAPALLLIGVEVALILVEPDLGTAVMILLLSALLLFLGGVALRHLFSLGLLMVPFLIYWIMKAPYRRDRVMAYLNPWGDASASGFQVIQSYLALGSGGLFGAGLGEGRQKLFFLPEPHTDFIFAVIGEELGLAGTFTLIFLFLFLLWKGMKIALAVEEPFGRMLAAGTTLIIVLPALMNMGVATGLLPTKGLALPFVSYGGSALLVNWLAIGILYNVSRGTVARKK